MMNNDKDFQYIACGRTKLDYHGVCGYKSQANMYTDYFPKQKCFLLFFSVGSVPG